MDQIVGLRSQWLAQISETIESAQKLAWQLRTRDGISSDLRELYNRLEAARVELQTIRDTDCWPVAGDPPPWLTAAFSPFRTDD